MHVLVAGSGAAAEATLASLDAQGYPCLRREVCEAGAGGRLRAALESGEAEYLLWLAAGDLLAPGALVALCLEAALSGAGAVAGLRVLFDQGVHALDVLADPPAVAAVADPGHGDVLVSREALSRAWPDAAGAALPGSGGLWSRLIALGVPRARIGRPVLLRHAPAPTEADAPAGLSIVSLTDVSYGGGAGIAHRRLTEALAMAGHRVAHRFLASESPAAAAEWTDDFPRTEAAVRANGHDLVLAGNMHGATRGGGLLARLSAGVPTAIVLHDLFALTGRCTHPKDCTVIASGCDARCPSPSAYPQLDPRRIRDAYAAKRGALVGPRPPLLLANSEWTAARARALAPAETGIARVQLAFPTNLFRPRERAALRRRLGLPQGDVLVMFAAVVADAPEKGIGDLAATMRAVARPGVGFVAIGRVDDARVFGLDNLHAPGPIGDEETLALWYAACDLYLTASRLETLGQTPIEAGLCGTPTVAYRATGLTSAVLDGVTGLLVPPRAGALAEALDALIRDADRRARLGAFARIVLESRFSHAAAAISLHDALSAWCSLEPAGKPGPAAARLRFAPEMLGWFACARETHPGAVGLVPAPPRRLVRSLRRAKQSVFGRGMPLWMRRALYAAALVRRRVAGSLPLRTTGR